MRTSAALLTLENLSVRYGEVRAVEAVDLTVGVGEVVSILGANGAGKSSLLRAISGEAGHVDGRVSLRDVDLLKGPRYGVARRGVAHVMEGRRVIPTLSVIDNLLLAANASRRVSRGSVPGALEEMYAYFPRLRERQSQAAGLLSGGEQQMLAIGRALMAKPDLLLLDEPSMGLAPIMIEEIYDILRARDGILGECSVLLAEQSAAVALSVSDRAYVLSRGSVVFEGQASELDAGRVAAAYLQG
ncbi:ABC transporter ATP-binding protein [Aeromicrobium sp. UC242_57]|uniref:ABC transporter ATP-binding protein n=1 Tax=Aeromicrobium sp. UC242_57 TaxID=3374624 RepID=UPI00379B62A0